jgi:hypothetical protein
MQTHDEQRQLDHVRRDLLTEFSEVLSPAVVDDNFDELVHRFDGAPVRSFVPILTRRAARERLLDLRQRQ